MSNWKFTTIHHATRIQMGITLNEYAIYDIIYRSQTHPDFNKNGWAENSYRELSVFLGMTKGTVHGIIDRGVELGFLEVNPANPRQKKTTEQWYNKAYLEDSEVNGSENERSENERKTDKSVRKMNAKVRKTNGINKDKFKSKVIKDKEEIRDESRTYPDDIAERIAGKGVSEDLLNDAVEKALAIIAAEKNDPPPVAEAPYQDFPESDEDLNPIDSFSFQDFWDAYGIKLDRAKCEAKWGKLKKSEIEEIERTLPFYISDTVRDDSEQEKNVWRRRRKNPITYLNGKTWNDYTDATGPMVKKKARIRDIKRTNATQIIDDKKYDKWRNKAQVT